MRIICNGKTVDVGDNPTVVLCPESIGCSQVNNGDIYDLCFSHSDIQNSNMVLEIGDVKIVIESQKTTQERKVKHLMEECKTTETAARFHLMKNFWSYAAAKLAIQMQRENIPKPCGEITLPGGMQTCNLGSDVLCSCQNGMVGTENCPVHGEKPIIVTDYCKCSYPTADSVSAKTGTCGYCGKTVPQSYDEMCPKTAEFQAQPRPSFAELYGSMEPGKRPEPPKPGYLRRMFDAFARFYGRSENPCAAVEDRGLCMECVCKEIGKVHCRLHSPLIETGGSD